MNGNQFNRHTAKTNIIIAGMALVGEPGLTTAQQIERLDVAYEALATASAAVIQARQATEATAAKAVENATV